jgi:hypothetical protein
MASMATPTAGDGRRHHEEAACQAGAADLERRGLGIGVVLYPLADGSAI